MPIATLVCALTLLAPAPNAGAPSGQVQRQVDSCRQRCATKPGLADTDRATCKLQCTAPARGAKVIREGTVERTTVEVHPRHVPQTASAHDALAKCQASCTGLATPDARATCKLTCRQTHKTTPPAVQSPRPGAGAPQPRPAVPSFDVTACYSSCEGMKGSSGVTCRLNCDATAKRMNRARPPATAQGKPLGGASARPLVKKTTLRPSPQSQGKPAQAEVATCKRACDQKPGLSDTDRATCKLGCKPSGVSVERWQVEGSPAQVRCWQACDCPTNCGAESARCETSCEAGNSTNAATCKLQCRSQAKSCFKACPSRANDCSCSATR